MMRFFDTYAGRARAAARRPLLRRSFLTALAGAAVIGLGAPLAPAAMAQGDNVVLTITRADGTILSLTEAEIAALPWDEVTTSTRWTDGPQHFRGPSLVAVLALAGLSQRDLAGHHLILTALNDFVIEMPAIDALHHRAVLAREANGVLMRVRDKGPFWLVFPRDDIGDLRDPVMDERWIWQLSQIRIVK